MPKYLAHVAVYLILKKNNQILLLCRKNTGFDDGKWSLPAGHVDENESALTALIREAKEEIGITINDDLPRLVYTLHRRSGDRTYIDLWFEVDSITAEPVNCEPHKCSMLLWANPNDLPVNTQSYVKFVLDNYHKNAYSSIGMDKR